MAANLENSAVATGLEEVSFYFNLKKGNAKECSNCHTIALILQASKVMLKILQARLQKYVNHELPDVQIGFRKGRGTRDQIVNIRCVCVCLVAQLCPTLATPWTVACQAPPSMGFSRQEYWNGFPFPYPLDHRKSKRISEKTYTSASLTTLKPSTVWITTSYGKFLKRWEYQTTLPAS